MGKSNGSVKNFFGFDPDTFNSSRDVPAATSETSGAKLAVLLAKSDGKIVALPCPERTVGVDG